MVPKIVPGKDHLAHAKYGSECGPKRDWNGGEHVDEQDGQDGIQEAELEHGRRECADRERADDHVGCEPLTTTDVKTEISRGRGGAGGTAYHRSDGDDPIRIGPFVDWHRLDAALLNMVPAKKFLQLGGPQLEFGRSLRRTSLGGISWHDGIDKGNRSLLRRRRRRHRRDHRFIRIHVCLARHIAKGALDETVAKVEVVWGRCSLRRRGRISNVDNSAILLSPGKDRRWAAFRNPVTSSSRGAFRPQRGVGECLLLKSELASPSVGFRKGHMMKDNMNSCVYFRP